jgi:hypothetical protein
MNQIKNFGIITESEWIGLSIKEAIEQAENHGLNYRIVEENGQAKMVTADLKSNRINFRLSNDRVVGAYGG